MWERWRDGGRERERGRQRKENVFRPNRTLPAASSDRVNVGESWKTLTSTTLGSMIGVETSRYRDPKG